MSLPTVSNIVATYRRLRAQPRNLVAIGVLISIVSLGPSTGKLPIAPGADADSTAMISLYADGQQRTFATESGTVGQVLKRANIKLNEHDIVEPAASSVVPAGQFNINVYRARPVTVVDGHDTYRLKSAYQSPRLLALAAGLVVYPEDEFRTQVVTDIVDDGTIGEKVMVTRAKPLNLKVDGKARTIRTQSDKISEALKSAGVVLGAQDAISVPADAPVTPGIDVSITRVSEAVVTLTDTIARTVKTVSDPTMLKGEKVVKQAGSDGQKTVTWRIHYRDGAETKREAIQVVSQAAPVDQIVTVGTKVFFAGSVEHWRPLVEAAAAQYGVDPNMMLRIMSCESKGNATVVSRFVVNGENPTGLFQFLPSTWRSNGGTNDNIFDGAMQIQIAARKMSKEGTRAWQCK